MLDVVQVTNEGVSQVRQPPHKSEQGVQDGEAQGDNGHADEHVAGDADGALDGQGRQQEAQQQRS